MNKINTKNKIAELIKQKQGITAKEIVAGAGITKAMVFRHLKNLLNEGRIIKIGTTPKVKYFFKLNMEGKTKLEQQFFDWAMTGDTRYVGENFLCPTRDVFQAREEKLLIDLKNLVTENLLYLLVGAVGEIGNNSFDHNLGNWIDIMGVMFAVDTQNRTILLADRGQGVLATIKRVRPQTTGNSEALLVAFTEIISGRAPEQRGNGLKYTKKIIEENNLYLEFYSGDALAKIAGKDFLIQKSNSSTPGTLVIIKF